VDTEAPERLKYQGWRQPLAWTALVVVVAVGAVAGWYWFNLRDEYERRPVPWQRFEVSPDGRTVTFFPYAAGSCDEPAGVDIAGDVASGSIEATVRYEQLIRRDGHPVMCDLGLAIGRPVLHTFDEPLDPDLVVVDGAPDDELSCPDSGRQRVGDPPPLPIRFFQC
jgi:hypothetical protein